MFSGKSTNKLQNTLIDLKESEENNQEMEVPPLEDVTEVLEKIQLKSSRDKDETSRLVVKEINQASLPKVASDTDFGGLKKGFLFCSNKAKKPAHKIKQAVKVEKEDIPFIKAKPANSGLKFKEVQEAMEKENPFAKVQEDITSTISSHPRVSEVLSDPAWLLILDEFQKDPQKAMIKYQHNEEVKETMKELCSILGDSFLHMLPSSKSEEDVLSKQLMEDPKLKETLLDPFVESVMDWMKEGRNDRVQQSLQNATPSQKAKIQLLIDHGLFSYVS